MDPITHGLVGAALSGFTGTEISIFNPLTIGATLGAMSPDLDFVIRIFKDDAAYLEHHRGKSHTLPYLIGFSIAITFGLSMFGLVGFNAISTFIWTLIGAVSHTVLDILNSYGAKFFKKKRIASILTLYDPVITMVGLWFIYNGQNTTIDLITGVLIVSVYLLMRNFGKLRAKDIVYDQLIKDHEQVKVTMMPSLKAFYKWDFVAMTATHNIVGQYNPMFGIIKPEKGVKLIQVLVKPEDGYEALFKSSKVGEVFTEFSHLIHFDITKSQEDELITIRAVDLRYFFKQRFMHHATLVIDVNHNIISSFIHPYTLNKAIPI